jgi:hypothetical protein
MGRSGEASQKVAKQHEPPTAKEATTSDRLLSTAKEWWLGKGSPMGPLPHNERLVTLDNGMLTIVRVVDLDTNLNHFLTLDLDQPDDEVFSWPPNFLEALASGAVRFDIDADEAQYKLLAMAGILRLENLWKSAEPDLLPRAALLPELKAGISVFFRDREAESHPSAQRLGRFYRVVFWTLVVISLSTVGSCIESHGSRYLLAFVGVCLVSFVVIVISNAPRRFRLFPKSRLPQILPGILMRTLILSTTYFISLWGMGGNPNREWVAVMHGNMPAIPPSGALDLLGLGFLVGIGLGLLLNTMLYHRALVIQRITTPGDRRSRMVGATAFAAGVVAVAGDSWQRRLKAKESIIQSGNTVRELWIEGARTVDRQLVPFMEHEARTVEAAIRGHILALVRPNPDLLVIAASLLRACDKFDQGVEYFQDQEKLPGNRARYGPKAIALAIGTRLLMLAALFGVAARYHWPETVLQENQRGDYMGTLVIGLVAILLSPGFLHMGKDETKSR